MTRHDEHETGEQPAAMVSAEGTFATGEGLAAGLVLGEAARHVQQTLDELTEGQRRLALELARTRRRSGWLVVLVIALTATAGWAIYQRVDTAPIVLPGLPDELDRDGLLAEVEGLSGEVRDARNERNRHLQESLRLREQLVDAERRLSDLTTGLGEMASRAIDRPEPAVVVSRTADRDIEAHPSRALVQALAASGIDDLSLVEHGAIEKGVLLDVLVARLDPWGIPLGAEHFDRARLESRVGLVSLVLESDALASGGPAQVERVAMPAADLAAWAAAGLALDGGVVTVSQAGAALSAVLEGQLAELHSLGGYDEGAFLDLVLIERDSQGVIQRTWTAGRAELLPVGPTLLLEDGSLEEGGVTRPFWNGRSRMVLEGARYGAFQERLRQAPAGSEPGRG